MIRLALAVLLCVPCLGACAAPEPEETVDPAPRAVEAPAPDPATEIPRAVEAIRAEAESEGPGAPGVDPVLEERCAGVTEEAMERVERKMSNLAGENVFLGPDEMLALTCARYRRSLEGGAGHD